MKMRVGLMVILAFLVSASNAGLSKVVRLSLAEGILKVTPYTDKIIRIQFAPGEKALNIQSLVVLLSPQQNHFSVEEQGKHYLLRNCFGSLVIDRSTGAIQFRDEQEVVLIKEKELLPKDLKLTQQDGEQGYRVANYFRVDTAQHLFSMELSQRRMVNLRNAEYATAVDGDKGINPFVVSSANYGIFWDNYCFTRVGNNPVEGTYFISEKAPCLDYYFILGDSMEEVINGYLQLIGEASDWPD
ncbi:MAG: DUF4968 domain-containing protein [Marinilabiliaceae bacterium]|nr:DUF4968 domain-containing protein [Marinilabiliaceae bacterium]